MDAKQRRQYIARAIEDSAQPLSASELARQLGVSRQVIVGDVALLRAEGQGILSTARGYINGGTLATGRIQKKLACLHRQDQTREELYTIVDLGGYVLDVVVEHPVYGALTGTLMLRCRADVDAFMDKISSGEARLLSLLTDGIHLHTISCDDASALERIERALAQRKLLYY